MGFIGAKEEIYRGADRRGRRAWMPPQPPARALRRMGVFGAAGAVTVLALVLAPGTGPATAANSLQVLSSLAEVAAGVAMLGAWKIGGRAMAGWLGVALTDRGVLSVAYHSLTSLRIGPASTVEPFGRLVVCVIVAASVLAAVRTAETDSRFRPLRTIGASTAFGMAVLVGLERVLGGLSSVQTSPMFERGVAAACATVWLLVAVLALGCAHRGAGFTRVWTAAYVCLLGISSAAGAAALSPWGQVGRQFGVFLAGCLIVLAAAWELRWTAQNQDRYALTLRIALTQSQAAMERERGQLDERLHDLRNAVAALRTADHTLRRYSGRLDDESKNRLADALTSELSRLQTLIEPMRAPTLERFRLPDALGPVLATERTCGSVIVADLPSTPVLGNRESLAQVVQNLLGNARKYAPGSPVFVSAERVDDRLMIRVSDRGPGIPEGQRELIFRRGLRGSTSAGTEGSGIGLHVASRLMAEMGGCLSVDEAGPGATFLVDLPVAAAPAPVAEDPSAMVAVKYGPDVRHRVGLN